ncbi:MAG TPA: 2-C-methyl-D-erythritol 2,4-cyclodiphosphate synthase [Dehalococcoidia bacterium]|nr:2-C-methyl-D-erythritol 2,4-cyclodiphosphate synthase [Dehalococcoidia bacterium]
MRIGIGYDIHKLKKGIKLMLGGIEIPFSYGLTGHSDADVLLHAIMDAMLGAAALKDIGYHFPTDDPTYKGVASIELLQNVRAMIGEKGLRVGNIDTTVIAEEPKIAPFIDDMRGKIAAVLDVHTDQVMVKATTNEGLVAAGNKKGIAAFAVALLVDESENVW